MKTPQRTNRAPNTSLTHGGERVLVLVAQGLAVHLWEGQGDGGKTAARDKDTNTAPKF